MKRIIVKTTYLMMLILFFISAQAETLQLGDLSFTRAPAPSLKKPVTLSPGFFRVVGGVAFDAIAVGKNGIIVKALEYDAKLPDGKRLVISVGKPASGIQKVSGKIYDWQLVPIAQFALSDNGSAMTLFGTLDDKNFTEELLKSGGRAINYHPALDNTLVGLRLMQADIMLFDSNAVDLPKLVGGDYILGAGEKHPDIERNKHRFGNIQKLLDQEEKNGNAFSSYVIGDLNTTVEFYIKNNQLIFTGKPTWLMWDNPSDLREAVNFMKLVRLASEDDQMALTILGMQYSNREELAQDMEKYGAILKRIDTEEPPVEIKDQLSKKISDAINKEGGINPIVYDTLTKVMHYRALFKHFKSRDPEAYERFVSSLAGVKILPSITTPTVQRQRLQ